MSSHIVALPQGLARAAWPSKSPDEVQDYGADWRSRLAKDETIASSTFVLPPGVVASKSTYSGAVAEVRISGGANGELYRILNRITTTAGRTLEQAIHLGVMSK
ncbi:hypothetical protein [Bradyrhizobium sp. 153]|uniref:phage fiber-tail adaptor protein n=1 Tax=Bradyrhizobium sp. 153 TaxID=2782627 RepID=UPI001FFAC7BC|nr:hypothetical protein [Bradyrhizobium sp. 153]MCK1669432.1 hypothetical protein [Bradyrhizobium sp. 153]